ncbi:MAG: helix-turn-helix domain-containing protein [Clostridia bacterium]|nr:helix-turn-helix domain-containing protein [Clostridia bacterium]
MKNLNLNRREILDRIAYFRNKKNLSVYQLGKMLGHAKTYFYRIESGEINLTIETLLDTLDILGVATAEFFYPDFENFSTDIEFYKN